MKKLAGLTLASLFTLALGGIATAAVNGVGVHPAGDAAVDATIIIEKELPDEYDTELPPAWAFRIDSVDCANSGKSIGLRDPNGNNVSTAIVDIDAEGGESIRIPVISARPDGSPDCVYRIREIAVDGWEPVSPAGGSVEVSPERFEELRVTFENRPVPPPDETTTTTTTEPEATTTTVAETTTTVAETTTTAAPTTAPPTTAGTVAPELPATGNSNALTGLLAGLLVIGGLGAVLASRRT